MGTMNQLPPELLGVIASYCPQADAVNLALSFRAAVQPVTVRLYRCIVFDTGPRDMRESVEYKLPGRGFPDGFCEFAVSVVRTAAGLKQCLRTLALHPTLANEVRYLELTSNVPLSDVTLRTLCASVFTLLTRLEVLQWSACPELPVDVLAMLPQPERLKILEADLAVRPWQKLVPVHFPGLRRLVVRPFIGREVLEWLQRAVAGASNLTDIWLSRSLDAKHEVSSGYAFVALADMSRDHVDVVESFFGPLSAQASLQYGVRQKLKLRQLGLIETGASSRDSEILSDAVDMSSLDELALAGEPTPANAQHLLADVMSRTTMLSRLYLDWPVSAGSIGRLLKSQPLIRSLRLVVRNDPAKIARAIGELPNLQDLTLTARSRFRATDFDSLSQCAAVKRLRIPFSLESPTWRLAMQLPSLEQLDLEYSTDGNSNGGNSHVSSNGHSPAGLVTSGLLSMWNDDYVQPLQYAGLLAELREGTTLDLVRINGHSHILRPRKSGSAGGGTSF